MAFPPDSPFPTTEIEGQTIYLMPPLAEANYNWRYTSTARVACRIPCPICEWVKMQKEAKEKVDWKTEGF